MPDIRLAESPDEQLAQQSSRSNRSKKELNFIEVYKNAKKEPNLAELQIGGDILGKRPQVTPTIVSSNKS